ncbi:MAG: DNA polymerase [Phycisphaerales bacterium]
MPLRTLFVDLDAFFASAEQSLRPELRGKPVAVVPVMADRTCCIAASYEAKRVGVKTGTGLREARQMCPGLKVVLARPEEYIRIHHRVLAAVDTCTIVDRVYSIDEFACRLVLDERREEVAVALAQRIKGAIHARVSPHLGVSVGIGPNRLLAKLASDMEKPNGLVVLNDEDLPAKLLPLKVSDFCGIGDAMEARLASKGVATVAQLWALSERQMAEVWASRVGRDWWYQLHGHEVADLTTRTKSIGHQHILPPPMRTDEGSRGVIIRLIHKAAARARTDGFAAGSLSVFLRFIEGHGWGRDIDLEPAPPDTLALVRAFAAVWPSKPRGTPIMAGVVLGRVQPAAGLTMPLFCNMDRARRLSEVMDTLNIRHGRNTVYLASMHGARETAPTRIPFYHIPRIDGTTESARNGGVRPGAARPGHEGGTGKLGLHATLRRAGGR